MYDIIIVGAGPAGLTAAIYARRASKKVLVLEAKTYGGQIINTLEIENYPAAPHISGFDFATKLYNQARELGTEFIFEKVVDIQGTEVKTEKNTYQAKAIILATGSENRKLNLAKEEDFIGKGISYCATCDGAFYKQKTVAVVGGGNTALEDALYLSDIVEKVYLIHRRDTFRGDSFLLQKLQTKKNVEFIYSSTITKLNGMDHLESIEVTNQKGEQITLSVFGLFIAIGRIPENENFAKSIKVDENGYIIAGENCHTNIPFIFACGDTRTKELRQLVTATSDGAIAASEAIKYINENE